MRLGTQLHKVGDISLKTKYLREEMELGSLQELRLKSFKDIIAEQCIR